MDSSSVEPLSVAVQVGLRVPVILAALAGVLIALLMIRRLGVLSGILAAGGSFVIGADQAVNIAWVLHLRSLTSGGDLDIDTFNLANNTYTIADALLITLGVVLVVVSFLFRRRPSSGGAVSPGSGGAGSPGFGGAGVAPAPYYGPAGPPTSAPPVPFGPPTSAPPAPFGPPPSAPPGP